MVSFLGEIRAAQPIGAHHSSLPPLPFVLRGGQQTMTNPIVGRNHRLNLVSTVGIHSIDIRSFVKNGTPGQTVFLHAGNTSWHVNHGSNGFRVFCFDFGPFSIPGLDGSCQNGCFGYIALGLVHILTHGINNNVNWYSHHDWYVLVEFGHLNWP